MNTFLKTLLIVTGVTAICLILFSIISFYSRGFQKIITYDGIITNFGNTMITLKQEKQTVEIMVNSQTKAVMRYEKTLEKNISANDFSKELLNGRRATIRAIQDKKTTLPFAVSITIYATSDTEPKTIPKKPRDGSFSPRHLPTLPASRSSFRITVPMC